MNKPWYALLLLATLRVGCWSQTAAPAHAAPMSGCGGVAGKGQQVREADQNAVVGRLIHKVQPKYPEAARKAHIEGTIVLCAVIGRDGKIASLRPLSGPAELTDSAMDAVHKWVYTPYLLNGEPVVVETDIRVTFKLN